ncbi:protein kinase [Frankia sp. CNm7]|uniref:Protein kinase n=1 Tax=Frankia nepalensis TaxID=1836974 RepID=A0A937UPV1_9ACTN|nr:protein kinase [Frankia nepalensis]MBL7500464.1 protein kinase [Frankia nepalensis]MBL7512816.1 protein kinase [Frankia nepalensis]MBL7522537.1 protein kinase [Frankia nepalensis]MBL7631244.1 protein kinase [Frankia nepalensis]
MPVVDRERIAAALPGLVLGRELGSGAHGLVLAATQREPERDVAVKVIDLGPAQETTAPPTDEAALPALTALDHPHLCRTHAVLTVDRILLLVTELLPGGSLGRQDLGPPAGCAVALAVADGLAHAHAAGILHGGLTPANVLFTAGGRPKLTDLGVAGLVADGSWSGSSSGSSSDGQIVGAPQYLAPEQITGAPLGPPTDLYALAAVLYELLAGAPLFGAGLTAQDLVRHHCEVVPPPPPGVPAPVADTLARALAKQPADRHQTAAEFALDLADAARRGYGPGWLEAAGIPVQVSDDVRARATQAVDPEPGTPLPVGPGPVGLPPEDAGGGPFDADSTLRLPPGGTLLPLPVRSAAPAEPSLVPTDATAIQTRSLGPRPADGTGTATPSGDAPAPAGAAPGGGRGGRSRAWRIAVPVAVAVAILAAAAAVVLPRALGSDDEPASPQAARRPAGPTAPPTVVPTSGPLSSQAPPAYPLAPLAGTGEAGFSGDGGPATAAALNQPIGPAIDVFGNLYVADFGNNRVRRISLDGTITTIAGTGEAGFSGDGGPATQAQLNQPAGVAIGPLGELYIVDTFNMRVRQVSPAGIITTVAGSGERPWDPDHDGGPATAASMWYPAGIAVDPVGNVFVADMGNDLIRRISVDGIITTVAGRFGEGEWGDGGPANEAMVSSPFSVACDRVGRVYIADSFNHKVRRINLDGTIETIAGTGFPGYSGDGGPAIAATLRNPRGVAVDAVGNVYITDGDNHRIRRIDLGGNIATIAGTADPGEAGVSEAAFLPDGPVVANNVGGIFATDRQHNQIILINALG